MNKNLLQYNLVPRPHASGTCGHVSGRQQAQKCDMGFWPEQVEFPWWGYIWRACSQAVGYAHQLHMRRGKRIILPEGRPSFCCRRLEEVVFSGQYDDKGPQLEGHEG